MQNYNPSNKHNNLGKKILIGGLVVLAAGTATVLALNYSGQDTPQTPYTPDTTIQDTTSNTTSISEIITTENQTHPETPLSLEEKLADRLAPNGPLSDTQIEKYTLDAYELFYNGGTYDKEIRDLAMKSLGRVIEDIVNSIFENRSSDYREVVVFSATSYRYLYGKDPSKVQLDEYKASANRLSKEPKEIVLKRFKRTAFNNLGTALGGYKD